MKNKNKRLNLITMEKQPSSSSRRIFSEDHNSLYWQNCHDFGILPLCKVF